LLLIGGLYLASFPMPVTTIFSSTVNGWEAFRMIMMAPFEASFYTESSVTITYYSLLWLANPLVWLGFFGIIRQKGMLVTASGLIAFLCGASACVDLEEMKIDVREYGFGYHSWLLSMLAMAFFGIWLVVAEPAKQRALEPKPEHELS
jgi:hypothetical protein